MVSKRFARPGYNPALSSPGFRLATACNLGSQSCTTSTGLGHGFCPKSGSKIPSGQKGDNHIDNPGPDFYRDIFVVPKKQKGSWRLIIDLSRLNRFLRVPHFKMKTTRFVATAILPGDWAISLALRGAYLHVPVHPDYQRYLRFYFEGRVYQFKAMPFGLASAPLIFQTIFT
jgi:hypothetical protein